MLLQLLRPALGVLEGIPAVQADALASALALPRARGAGDGPDRFTIGAAVLSLICRYAEDGAVAVVVDDLHLADTPSAGALVFAARRLAADPVVALFGVRSPEGDAVGAGLPELVLGGLDLESARALMAGEAVPDENVRMLHRATAGNPLALLELRAADVQVIESVETGLPLRVPRAVAEAFGRRLEDLEADCRTALLAAAVCGTDLRLVGDACAAVGVDVESLGAAEDRGLVSVRRGRVGFRHPLVRAAVYSGASTQERRAMHGAAAAATPATDPDRRAWHLAEATWHPDAAVADLLADSAEGAVARAAYAVASGAFERSARLTPGTDLRRERLLRAADAAWAAGGGGRALQLLDERARDASAEAGEPWDAREVEVRASIAARTGSLREALDLLLVAADRADAPDDETLALADAVHATYYLGDARTASGLADRLGTLEMSLTQNHAKALGLMATGMAKVLAGRGGADDIRAAVPLLATDPALLHDPRRLSWLMLAPLYLRDASGGAQLRALVDEVRDRAGVGALPAVLFHVARDQAASAQWARAEANYSESIRLATETGQTTELAMSLAGLCWLEARSGKADASRAHAAEARILCEARDIHIGEAWVEFALGDVELSVGNTEQAVQHFTALIDLLKRLGLHDVDLSPAPELADALLRLGRGPEALELVEDVPRGRDRQRTAVGAARADRACGQAARDGEFDEWFRSALARHEQTLDRFESARTRLAYGERLRRAGRRVDARGQLRTALDDFSDLGAIIWRDRTAVELTATGEHVRTTAVDAVDRAHPTGASGEHHARRRTHHPRGRRRPVPQPEDRGVPPAQGLYEARHQLARRAVRSAVAPGTAELTARTSHRRSTSVIRTTAAPSSSEAARSTSPRMRQS